MTARITDLAITAADIGPCDPAAIRARYAAARARIHRGNGVVDTLLPPVPKVVVTALTDLRPGEVLLPAATLDERAPSSRRIVATAAAVFRVEQHHLVSPLTNPVLGPARRVTAHVGVRVCGRPPADVGRWLGWRTAAVIADWADEVHERVSAGDVRDAHLAQMVADLRGALGV